MGLITSFNPLGLYKQVTVLHFYVLHTQPVDGYVASRNMLLLFILITICKNKAVFRRTTFTCAST
jgi:hypothetical protein